MSTPASINEISCEELSELLWDLDEISPELKDKIAQHLNDCESCRESNKKITALKEGFTQLYPMPEKSISASVMASIRATTAMKKKKSVIYHLATVASLFLMVGFFAYIGVSRDVFYNLDTKADKLQNPSEYSLSLNTANSAIFSYEDTKSDGDEELPHSEDTADQPSDKDAESEPDSSMPAPPSNSNSLSSPDYMMILQNYKFLNALQERSADIVVSGDRDALFELLCESMTAEITEDDYIVLKGDVYLKCLNLLSNTSYSVLLSSSPENPSTTTVYIAEKISK